MRTSAGTSLPSPAKLFTTPWQRTELEKFRDSLGLEDMVTRNEMTRKIDTTKNEMTSKITQAVANIPKYATCAYKTRWSRANSKITYDKLISDTDNGNHGRLSTGSGVFTANTAGAYLVTLSGRVYMDPGQRVVVYLYHNGGKVEESVRYSFNGADVSGGIGDQGSWSMVSLSPPPLSTSASGTEAEDRGYSRLQD